MWGTITTSVTPGIAWTLAWLRTDSALPLMVGGRHSIVGSAPGTLRSIANCLAPVTMSCPSIRLCGVPTIVCCDAGFSATCIRVVRLTAARLVSWPNVIVPPPGAWITPLCTV